MTITIDDFAKVEIRVGTVISAEKAEGADKLIKFIFDFGSAEQNSENEEKFVPLPDVAEKYPGRDVRQVMSAIAEFFPDPEVLVGKQICVCTNLEPRKFRGHESRGMILAVDNPEGGITFIGPEGKVPAGVKLH
jgi:methionyl-tRNA synthetase